MKLYFLVLFGVCGSSLFGAVQGPVNEYLQELDELDALWSYYKYSYIKNGKVVSLDENEITTSEGQGYAMLRAMWSSDLQTFESVWQWTKKNLQIRDDKLFAWKYKEKVLDKNSATDADTDIALALLLASSKFDDPVYFNEALKIINDIWSKEIIRVKSNYFVTAGNWAPHEKYPTIHVAYLAPYAYEKFATVNPRHQWKKLASDSYKLLNWIFNEKKFSLPPEIIFVDKTSGKLLLHTESGGKNRGFSYDSFPIYWRLSLDYFWFARKESNLRKSVLKFFEREWKLRGKFFDKYLTDGTPQSKFEALPLYATVHSLAAVENPNLADQIYQKKLLPLFKNALSGKSTPYYLHNWLWFDKALLLKRVVNFEEVFGFLRPFNFKSFVSNFPFICFLCAIAFWLLLRIKNLPFMRLIKTCFVVFSVILCLQYLGWRFLNTLNFKELLGPPISISLWLAEVYCFFTVLLLLLQVGLHPKNNPR